jgi:hypothetical protein
MIKNEKCPHGRSSKYTCIRCSPQYFCMHGRSKYSCGECGGSQFCEHHIRKWTCRKCGSNFCGHNRTRSQCSICKPECVYGIYKRVATRKQLSFLITLEQFISIVSQPCAYCGEDIEPRGVDRWDNNIGYEFLNCLSCCKVCNFLKHTMDGSAFVDRCRWIADTTRIMENTADQKAWESRR